MPDNISIAAGNPGRAVRKQIAPIMITAIHHGNVPNIDDEYPQPFMAPAIKPSIRIAGFLVSVKLTADKDMPNPQLTEPRVANIAATLFVQNALIMGSRIAMAILAMVAAFPCCSLIKR